MKNQPVQSFREPKGRQTCNYIVCEPYDTSVGGLGPGGLGVKRATGNRRVACSKPGRTSDFFSLRFNSPFNSQRCEELPERTRGSASLLSCRPPFPRDTQVAEVAPNWKNCTRPMSCMKLLLWVGEVTMVRKVPCATHLEVTCGIWM